jgi:hypothetical protein
MEYLSARAQTVALKTFAGIGFITVLGAGLWLAAYAITSSPALMRNLGAAAVYLSTLTSTKDEPTLLVIEPTEETPLVIEEAIPEKIVTPSNPAPKTPGEKTEQAYALGSTAPSTPVSGLPDLVVRISAIGYLTSTSTDSFVASSTVPTHMRPAVRFTVTNQGTNTTGAWKFSASIPTQSAYIFQSPPQQPLASGDSIEYVLGFDQANTGSDKMISITANSDSAFTETTRDNNSASAKITILGS